MNRILYTALLYVLIIFTPFKLLWRARKQPEYLQHWCERYGFYEEQPQKPIIWLHCVSVGETRAAAPLVHALMLQHPKHRILLTHATPTGRATAKLLFSDSVQSVYLPYDLPFAVHHFLAHFKPTIGVLMETELWFNLIAACKQKKIPLLLVNARLSEKSARGYAKLGLLAKQGLADLTAIAAQTEDDASRLTMLGANNVTVVGNLKFDVNPPKEALLLGEKLRHLIGKYRPVFLAASTRDGEEALILDTLLKVNVPNLLTVIVPRHPQRFDEVEALLKAHCLAYEKRSDLNSDALTISEKTQYLLGNSMGELFTYYAICDVAFIGGSLLPFGGQNLIEACAVGKPSLVGPHTFNFTQVANLAIEFGATKRVKDVAGLAATLNTLLVDQNQQQQMAVAALQFSQINQGATERVARLIEQFI